MNWIEFLFGTSVGMNVVFFCWWISTLDRYKVLDDLINYLRRELESVRHELSIVKSKLFYAEEELKKGKLDVAK